MGKLFGTDGIRGVANRSLTCDLAFRTGQAAAISLAKEKNAQPTVVIGMDTRISSDMLENALLAGLCSCGCNAVRLGVIPTPAVAYLTLFYHADAGIVISASHNPYEYNGIKMFSSEGFKLNDTLEEEIEELILSDQVLPTKTHSELGKVVDGRHASDYYIRHLISTVEDISDLRVLVDCANGAASATAPQLFARFRGLHADIINAAPNGVNINDNCGSTHIEQLAELVKAGEYDLGIAFDGDADRCLAVDENGILIDGDQVMAVCGMELEKKGELPEHTLVATVMSNLGFHIFAKEHGLNLVCTAVGDRNVLEEMERGGFVLGGEQSGHTIFRRFATTGDGELTALQLLAVLYKLGEKPSEAVSICARYPQTLLNVKVSTKEKKEEVMSSTALQEMIRQVEEELAGQGRVLVRPSGTEPLVRVMVEAQEEHIAFAQAEKLANLIKTI